MGHRFRDIAAVALMVIIAGCAAPEKKKEETVFFPPAPDLPRIQYFVSFSGQKDIEEETSFKRFVVGEKVTRKLDKPYGTAIYDGKIYVCDTNTTLMVFDLKARTFDSFKGAKGPGKLIQPLNISIGEDGSKYVTDPVRGQVVAFDKNDQYVKAYGTPGKWKPVDAAVFEDRVYVADNLNGQVRVFDKRTGELTKTIGDKGEPSERLGRPTNVAFDRAGDLYVTDVGRFQVVRFDRDGHFKGTVGKLGDNLGHFTRPRGLSLDRDGILYAVDASFNNVQMFNKNGRLLMFFGEAGTGPGNLLLPAKVVIDYDNVKYFQQYASPSFETEYLVIVTSQFGDRLVNVFGYGKEKGKKYPSEEEVLKMLEEKRKEELDKLRKVEEKGAVPEDKKATEKEGPDGGTGSETPAGK